MPACVCATPCEESIMAQLARDVFQTNAVEGITKRCLPTAMNRLRTTWWASWLLPQNEHVLSRMGPAELSAPTPAHSVKTALNCTAECRMNFLLSVLRQRQCEQAKLSDCIATMLCRLLKKLFARKRRTILVPKECDQPTEEQLPRPLTCRHLPRSNDKRHIHSVLVHGRHPRNHTGHDKAYWA